METDTTPPVPPAVGEPKIGDRRTVQTGPDWYTVEEYSFCHPPAVDSWQPLAKRLSEEDADLLANGHADLARLRALLVEIYRQVGNDAPSERRHALTPSLRDAIRAALAPRPGADQLTPDAGRPARRRACLKDQSARK